jgi:hypothetical protein
MPSSTAATAYADADRAPDAWLRRLWERFMAAFPGTWAARMGESPQRADGTLTVAGDTWARDLAGLSGPQLARGLERALASCKEWPPTLPIFKAWCLGIPSLSEVKADLCKTNAERMPFTVAVWRRVDPWSYRHAPELVADKLLERAYQDVHEAVMRGQPLPAPEPVIEHKPEPPKSRDPAVAKAAMAEIRERLGMREDVKAMASLYGEVPAGEAPDAEAAA